MTVCATHGLMVSVFKRWTIDMVSQNWKGTVRRRSRSVSDSLWFEYLFLGIAVLSFTVAAAAVVIDVVG